jgi:hypothetical protein
MSKQVRKHPLMMWRLLGYLTPLICFIALVLWFKPRDEIGWTAVLFGTLMSLVVSFATLTQARSEAHKKKHRTRPTETISLMAPRRPEPRFIGQYGEQDMSYWLSSQP